MDPVLALVIIVALVCITVVVIVLTNNRGGASIPRDKAGKNAVAESRAVQVTQPAPALQNITFKQALESDALATGLEDLAKRQVEYALGIPAANAAVRAVSLAEQQDQLVIAYEFSRNGKALLETGEAVIPLQRESGRFLPMLKDSDAAWLTEVSAGSPLQYTNSTNAAALLAGLAHVVPGMDVLRRLKEVDRRLSVLAEGRKVDQLAEMETIYNRLCEIFSRKNWMDRRSDLIATRDQLFKLRATWRRELDQILDSAPETPDTQAAEGLWNVFLPFSFIGKGLEMHRESEEQKLFGHLAATADLMQRIRLAMLLDIAVSQALGEAETLAGVAMRNELEMWDGIAEKFESKRKDIRTFNAPGDLQTVEDALRGYVNLLASVTAMKATATEGTERKSPQPGTGHPEHEPSAESRSSPPVAYLGAANLYRGLELSSNRDGKENKRLN